MTVEFVAAYTPAVTGPFAVLAISYAPPVRPIRRAPTSLRVPRDPTAAHQLAALFADLGAE